MVTFQILTPTIPGREFFAARLQKAIGYQLAGHPGASHRVFPDLSDRKETIGEKRARAIQESTADYVAFVDDDDLISKLYLSRVMPALEKRPDCCGLSVAYYQDGKFQSIFQHSLQHRENTGWQGFARTPHHLCPIRRDIAASIEWPAKSWGEDYAFAMAVLPKLQTEEWLGPDPLYNYMFVSGKPGSVL